MRPCRLRKTLGLITLKTQAEARLAQERAASAGREATANAAAAGARADANDAERERAAAQAQTERIKSDAQIAAQRAVDEAKAQAERTKLDAQVAAQRAADEAKAQAERAKSDAQLAAQHAADETKAQAERSKADAELAAKNAADETRAQAERSKADAELAAQRAASDKEAVEAANQLARKSAAEQQEREKQELRNKLVLQLNTILKTQDTARGLIVNMSDVLFDTGQYSLKPGAREKLAKISGIVLAHPTLRLEVEGHTDSVGTDKLNMLLSENRATSVRDFLIHEGIVSTSIASRGFGKSQPVATNDTADRPATESPSGISSFRRSHRKSDPFGIRRESESISITVAQLRH